MVRLVVDLLRLDDGRVMSSLGLDEPDEAMQHMSSWPNGGLSEAGYALLVEAVRREAVLGLLLSQSALPEFMQQLDERGPDAREIALRELSEKVASQVSDLTSRIVYDVVREVYDTLK